MKRSKHSLSHYQLATMDMGELVPVGCYEVLPGDSVQQATSVLLRCSPLLAPVMHPVTVRVHHWFVPHRLVWDGWEDFITGGSDGIGGSSGNYPTATAGASGFTAGSLMDYFGIPPGVANLEVGVMPIRAYNLIWNEYYRDQDLSTELTVPTSSGVDSTSPRDVQKVAWEKDYFTAARPWPQKGPDVTLPLGGNAPIVGLGRSVGASEVVANATVFETDNSAAVVYATGLRIGDAVASRYTFLEQDPVLGGQHPAVYADLASATSVDINDVRRAFALQRYQEARALYGSRYTEYLRYLGVRSSDARLQRPEYLGGGKQTISFSEVLQTGPTTSGNELGVANLKGHGISAMRSGRYRRFFEEHGHVLTLMSVRPRSMYNNGMDRMWRRRTKEDYWQKELEAIGQQEVSESEVYAAATATGVFGYQDRYSEYRHIQSHVSADFRSTLNFWHLARIFAAKPTLNADFITCEPSKRINAVQTNDVLWCMINNSIQARRMVSKNAIGRVL